MKQFVKRFKFLRPGLHANVLYYSLCLMPLPIHCPWDKEQSEFPEVFLKALYQHKERESLTLQFDCSCRKAQAWQHLGAPRNGSHGVG